MRHVLVVLLGSVLAACSGTKPAESAAEPPAAAPPAEPAPAPAAPPAAPEAAPTGAAAAAPSDRVEEAAFKLAVTPVGAYAAGKLGSFALTIEPRGEWHINQDFPTEVTIKGGEGVSLPSMKLDKKAAAEFGEEVARFDVPFTASAAGEHEIECNVRFAMCSKENCIPEERTVALALKVD